MISEITTGMDFQIRNEPSRTGSTQL